MSYTTKYYVNEDKRTVVCVIQSRKLDAVNFMEKTGFEFLQFSDKAMQVMPTRFVGVARCSPEDKYDEHIGRLIAFDRAKEKYDMAFIHAVESMYDYQLNMLKQCEQRLDKYINKASQHHFKRVDKIEAYMNK